MAKSFDQIVREMLGSQMFEIARLTAANQALAEENVRLKAEQVKAAPPATDVGAGIVAPINGAVN